MNKITIGSALVALSLCFGGMAYANGDESVKYPCAGGGYTFDPNFDCGGNKPNTNTNTNTNDNDATGVGVGVGVGIGTGVGTGIGTGGNATGGNATGGAGGNATGGTGGNAVAGGGAGGQGGAGGAGGAGGQGGSGVGTGGSVTGSGNSDNTNTNTASGGNANSNSRSTQSTNIDNSVINRSSAASAVSSSIQGCGGTAGGGFSAAIQTFGWGVSAARCKGDRFEQVMIAEERAMQGHSAAAAYLAAVDGSARKALVRTGYVIDISKRVIATPIAARCEVLSRHRNGVPKEVRAIPSAGYTVDQALRSCVETRGLILR